MHNTVSKNYFSSQWRVILQKGEGEMGIKSIVGAICVCLAIIAFNANAAVITLSEGGLNFLEVQFTVPVQPAQHNALNIGVIDSTGPSSPSYSAIGSLYDGGILLANSVTSSIGERYATVGSFFSATDPIIDYTNIANGTIDGLFTLLVTSGSRTFDTNDLFIKTFGDSGNAGFDGTITSVQTSTVVPVPATVWLFGSGLIGLIGFAKRKHSV